MINPADIRIDELPSVALTDRKHLPEIAAVYLVFDKDNQLLYVGQTQSLLFRFLNHSHQFAFNRNEAARIQWVCSQHLTLKERKSVERGLIVKHAPALNKQCIVQKELGVGNE